MVVDDLFSVIHAAVTDFDCVAIEDSSKFVVFWEMLVYYGKELVCDIGADIFLTGGLYQSRLFCCWLFCLLVVGGS